MDDCVFCKIIQGAIPSHKVHEDEATLAFLDIHPLARGHTLVIPKRHAARVEALRPSDASALFLATQTVARRLTKVVGTPAATIAINDGEASGQEVPHVHVHVVPRRAGDGAGPIHALFAKRPSVPKEDFVALAKTLAQA